MIPGIHDYGLFVVTCILLNLTPGQDTFYIIASSVAHGRRIGIASALGILAGCGIHTLAAAIGLSAILQTSATAFLVVKLAGAAYLIYLGMRSLMAPAATIGDGQSGVSPSVVNAFWRGTLSNVLNPKVALFFLALLPQFVNADSDARVGAFLFLGLTFIFTGTAWCLFLAVAAASVRSFFKRRPGAFAWLTRISGALFVGLGLRLAATER